MESSYDAVAKIQPYKISVLVKTDRFSTPCIAFSMLRNVYILNSIYRNSNIFHKTYRNVSFKIA